MHYYLSLHLPCVYTEGAVLRCVLKVQREHCMCMPCICNTHTCVCMNTHTCVYIHTHVCTHDVRVCVCVCVYVCVCVCVYKRETLESRPRRRQSSAVACPSSICCTTRCICIASVACSNCQKSPKNKRVSKIDMLHDTLLLLEGGGRERESTRARERGVMMHIFRMQAAKVCVQTKNRL